MRGWVFWDARNWLRFKTMSQFTSIMKDSKGNPSCKSFFISMMKVVLKQAWIKNPNPWLVSDLPCAVSDKSWVEILQNFVAFSEYMNFTKPSLKRQLSLFIQTYITVATLIIVPLDLFNRKITYSFKSQSRYLYVWYL